MVLINTQDFNVDKQTILCEIMGNVEYKHPFLCFTG